MNFGTWPPPLTSQIKLPTSSTILPAKPAATERKLRKINLTSMITTDLTCTDEHKYQQKLLHDCRCELWIVNCDLRCWCCQKLWQKQRTCPGFSRYLAKFADNTKRFEHTQKIFRSSEWVFQMAGGGRRGGEKKEMKRAPRTKLPRTFFFWHKTSFFARNTKSQHRLPVILNI